MMVLTIPYVKFQKETQALFLNTEILYMKNSLVKGVYTKPIASDVANCISHDIIKKY